MNVEKEGTSQLLLDVNQIKGNQCLIIIHNKFFYFDCLDYAWC